MKIVKTKETEVKEEAQPTPTPSPAVERLCPHDKTPIPEGASHCPACGTRYSQEAALRK